MEFTILSSAIKPAKKTKPANTKCPLCMGNVISTELRNRMKVMHDITVESPEVKERRAWLQNCGKTANLVERSGEDVFDVVAFTLGADGLGKNRHQ